MKSRVTPVLGWNAWQKGRWHLQQQVRRGSLGMLSQAHHTPGLCPQTATLLSALLVLGAAAHDALQSSSEDLGLALTGFSWEMPTTRTLSSFLAF